MKLEVQSLAVKDQAEKQSQAAKVKEWPQAVQYQPQAVKHHQ